VDVLTAFHSDKGSLYQESESFKPDVTCFTETYSIFYQHAHQQDAQARLHRVQFHISCECWSCIQQGRSLCLLKSSENFVAQFTGKTYKYLQNTLILSNIHVGNENGQRFCLGCDTK